MLAYLQFRNHNIVNKQHHFLKFNTHHRASGFTESGAEQQSESVILLEDIKKKVGIVPQLVSAASSFGSTLVDEGGNGDGQTPIETLRIHGSRHVLTVACFNVDQLKGYLVFTSRSGDDLSQAGRKSVDQGAGTGQSGPSRSKSPSPPPQVMTSNESNRGGAGSPGLEDVSQNVQGGKNMGEMYVKGEDLVCGLNPKLNELIRDCVNCISGATVKKKK